MQNTTTQLLGDQPWGKIEVTDVGGVSHHPGVDPPVGSGNMEFRS